MCTSTFCTTGAWAASGRVHTAEAVLLLEVSATDAWAESGRVCTTEVCAAPGVSTPQGPELHLDVSALQRHVLLLEVPTHWGLSCIWTFLIHRDLLTYCWTCLLHFENNLLTVGRVCFENNFLIIKHVHFDLKIIFFLTNVFASLRNNFLSI
jgi:hypothetical protein